MNVISYYVVLKFRDILYTLQSTNLGASSASKNVLFFEVENMFFVHMHIFGAEYRFSSIKKYEDQ